MSGAAATGGEEMVFNAEDRRVRVLNPRKSPAGGHPVHASIFQVRSACKTCKQVAPATCFMVEQLNKGRDHPCYYFTTAAHVLCCSDCGEYCWIQIVYEWDPKKPKPSSTFLPDETFVEENNDRGWLRVPEDYVKNCGEGKGDWDRYLYDYGIIALRKDNLEQRLKDELDKLSGENAMVRKPMAQQPRMESVDQAFLCGFPGEVKKEAVRGHMYWMPVDKAKKAEPLLDDIGFKKRSGQERETSALFAMPQRHTNDGDGDGNNKSSSNQDLVVKRLYRHYIDSSGGQSGSPVYSYDDEEDEYIVYGIHAGYWRFEDAKSNLYCNVAVRMQEVYKDMSEWIKGKEDDKHTAKPAQKHSTEGFVEKKQRSYLFGTGIEGMKNSKPGTEDVGKPDEDPTTALPVDSPLGPIGSKRLKDIDDPKKFAKSLQDFVDKNERKDFGRKAVEAVDPSRKNNSPNVLRDFHQLKEDSIDGPWKGQENFMCIIYYLIVKKREMTIHALFEMLTPCAPQNTGRIKKELMAASYE
ncbi:uncharacterized protein LOC135828394 [Sycon ciliatum]|uniref:uncharacterized protein LOC135828394 n=1 Tax=Sycon ciliatum TaxID=27933 RepID=UPI0031F6AFE6